MSSLNRRQFLLAAFGAGGAAAIGLTQPLRSAALAAPLLKAGATSAGSVEQLQFARRAGFALGSEVSMLALHPSKSVAVEALDAAFAELETVESVMSIYRGESQLSELNRRGTLQTPHPYLVSVLKTAQQAAERSNGAFDVTVQPLWDLYTSAKKENRLPSRGEIEKVRTRVDWRKLSLSNDRITLKSPGMAITLNGIAQGFAADRAVAALRDRGVTHGLLNTGEIAALGRKASNDPWVVGVQHPRREDAFAGLARLEGLCLSTSGDYETTFSNDFLYNHIFDPSTGCSPTAFSSVTVVCASGVEADALSTAVFVAGPGKGAQLLEQYKATGFFIMKDGTTLKTDGFPLA